MVLSVPVPSSRVNCNSFFDFGTATHSLTFTARKSDLLNVSKSTNSSNKGSTFTLEKSIFSDSVLHFFRCFRSCIIYIIFLFTPSKDFIVGKTDSLTILSHTIGYYTLFSKRLQPIIRYYSVCICCSSVAHHIILLHLIESNPQGLFPRICLNYVIIFYCFCFFISVTSAYISIVVSIFACPITACITLIFVSFSQNLVQKYVSNDGRKNAE